MNIVDKQTPSVRDDMPSLAELFNDHYDAVFLAAYRISGSVQDAEDVLQTVFLRLLKRDDFPGFSVTPAAYLCKAAINASLDIVRGRQRSPIVESDEGDCSNVVDLKSVETDMRQRELRRQLRSALAVLQPRAAEIFALRYFEDFDNAEIAEMFGTSAGSIAVTLHRTRERLQELLQGNL